MVSAYLMKVPERSITVTLIIIIIITIILHTIVDALYADV